MTHRNVDQLREAADKLVERLQALRANIKEREAKEMSRLAVGYAKVMKANLKAGGTLLTPAQLAALLTVEPAKPVRRRRAARAAPAAKRRGRKAAA